jgi:hypothetical protein
MTGAAARAGHRDALGEALNELTRLLRDQAPRVPLARKARERAG